MNRKGKCFGRKVRSLFAILLSVSFLMGDISVSLAAEQTGTDAAVEIVDTTYTSDISESDSQSTVSENQTKEEEVQAEEALTVDSEDEDIPILGPLGYLVGTAETVMTDEGDIFYQSIPFSHSATGTAGSLDVAISNKAYDYDDYLTRATYTGSTSAQYYLNWRFSGDLIPSSHSEQITVYYNDEVINTWTTNYNTKDYWWVYVGKHGTGKYKVEVVSRSSDYEDGSLTNSFEFLYRDEPPVIGEQTIIEEKNSDGDTTAYNISWDVSGTNLQYKWFSRPRKNDDPFDSVLIPSGTNSIQIVPTESTCRREYYLQVSNYGNASITSDPFKIYKPCNAQLDANGGSCKESSFRFINLETDPDTFPVAEKDGYDFAGWCTDLEDTENTMYSANTYYGSSVTLYAVYTPKKYTVKYYDLLDIPSNAEMTYEYFDDHYGSEYDDEFTYMEDYTIPEEMKSMDWYGYDFNGWYINGDRNSILTDGMELDYKENIFLLPLYTPKKENTVFNANGGTFYQKRYDEEDDEYLYTNMGTSEEIEQEFGALLQIPQDILYKKGYDFGGWYTTMNCIAGSEVSETNLYTLSYLPPTTYYAKWIPKVYTLYFYDEKYNLLQEKKTVVYNERYGQLPIIHKKGAYFAGWQCEINNYQSKEITESDIVGSLGEIPDTLEETHGDAMYLYPRFTTITKDVYINTNGGTVIENGNPVIKNVLTLPVNGYCETLPNVEREGYVFAGWHADTVDGKLISDNSYLSYNDFDFTTLVAAWVPEDSTDLVQITFNTDSNDSSNTIATKVKGQTYGTMPQPVRTGYYFAGWYTDHNGAGSYVGKTTTVASESNIINLYAKWTPRRYKVSFHSDIPIRGISSATDLSKEMEFGAYYSLPNVTAQDYRKYTFLGWYTADGEQVNNGSTRMTVAGDHTLYARFEQSYVILTMQTNGGTFVEDTENEYDYSYPIGKEKWETEIDCGAFSDYYDASLPPVARTGYTFAGWKKADGSVFTKDTYMSSDTVVNATWIANQYTVTFQANGGNCSETTRKVAYNIAVGNLPTATRTGYKLSGWSVNGVMVNAGMIITGDVILTAVWEKQNTIAPSVQSSQQPSSTTTTDTTTNVTQTPKPLEKPVITIKPVGKKGKNQVQIKWKKVTGATKYIIYRSTDKKKYQEYKIVTATSYIDKSRKEGKNYYYKVKAVSGSQETVKIKVVGKKTSVKLSWEKENNTVYYDIYRAVVGKTGYQKIKTTKSLKYTDKKLNKKKKYAYRIEAKKNYKESSASNIESCKTDIKIKFSGKKFVWEKKGFPDGAEVYVYQVNNNKAKLWKKVKVKTGKLDVSSIKPQKFKFALVYPDGKKKKTICEKIFKSRHM